MGIKEKDFKDKSGYWELGYDQSYHAKGNPVQKVDNVLSPVHKGSDHDMSHVKKDSSRLEADMGKKKSKQKSW